ncbi:MAG: LytR C-terminal domain-containing protein [Propionibacterium sp.]
MRRWVTPVILVVLVAMMAFGLWWGWKMLMHPIDNSSSGCVTKSASTLTTSQVQIRVLNAGTVRGRAGDIATTLTSKGFSVVSTTNTSNQVSGTTVIGATADDPEVLLVAGFLPGAKLTGDGRSDHRVDVVVNDQFAGFTQDAPTTVNVPGGKICVPASSSSATP